MPEISASHKLSKSCQLGKKVTSVVVTLVSMAVVVRVWLRLVLDGDWAAGENTAGHGSDTRVCCHGVSIIRVFKPDSEGSSNQGLIASEVLKEVGLDSITCERSGSSRNTVINAASFWVLEWVSATVLVLLSHWVELFTNISAVNAKLAECIDADFKGLSC